MKEQIAISVACLAIIAVFVGFSVARSTPSSSTESSGTQTSTTNPTSSFMAARELCVDHGTSISMHIHPTVSIFVDGKRQEIPANVGIDSSCMRALHTHDASGKIHIEYPEQYTFTLGDFFLNWGETFYEQQILEHVVDDNHQIRMMVDGEESEDYEDLILEDLQKIEIYYEAVE